MLVLMNWVNCKLTSANPSTDLCLSSELSMDYLNSNYPNYLLFLDPNTTFMSLMLVVCAACPPPKP